MNSLKGRRKQVLFFCCVLVIGLLVAGCGGSKGSTENKPQGSSASQPIELKVLASWGEGQGNPGIELRLMPLIEKINEKGKDKVKMTWRGPEAVPPFEQLSALRNGSFDFLFTNGAYHSGDTVIGITTDLIVASAKEMRDEGINELLDEVYLKKANARVLSLMGVGSGYQIIFKDKVDKADFSGLKIRATAFYTPLIEALGGVVVSTPVTEIYSSLEKGVVDGAAYMAIGVQQLKFNEVTKYLLRPTFGEGRQMFFVNEDTWQKLPEDVKQIINDSIREIEDSTREELHSVYEKEEKELVDLGMQLLQLPQAEADKFLKTFHESSWNNLILSQEPEYGAKIKKIADKFPYGWQ